MINTWFTSDTHFGHKNILEFEKEARPFSSLEEMHEVMIERWNKVVASKDVVYHLGDFCFGKQYLEIASRLNGKKTLVMGNHDMLPSKDYLQYFHRLAGCIFWKGLLLTHIPVDSTCLWHRASKNIHGHLHSKNVLCEIIDREGCIMTALSPFHFNVSCEQNNLTPFHIDEIIK